MSGGYTIAAIPTAYRGRTYRSRLEARWAAFFDRLGWKHEYEPFDLGKWSPDFLLHAPGGPTLCEVKPITEFDADTADRMCRARPEHYWLALLKLAPTVNEDDPRYVNVGWVANPAEDNEVWNDLDVAWRPFESAPGFAADLHTVFTGPGDRTNALWLLDPPGVGHNRDWPPGFPEHTLKLWAEATGEVQWKGPAT